MSKFDYSGNSFNYRGFLSIIFLFVSLIIIILSLLPMAQELKNKRDEVREKRSEFETKEEFFANIYQAKQGLEKYQDQVLMINHALPDNPSLPALFNYLQTKANESGLVLLKVGNFKTSPFFQETDTTQEFPDEENQASSIFNINQTEIDIELVGTYSSFKEFISKIERSVRLIRVENISFSSDSEKQENNFSFNLKIKVYSY